MPLQDDLVILFVGIVSFIYLLNPTAGILEFIPDNIPFVGNLDEFGATAALIYALNYFNVDVLALFGSSRNRRNNEFGQAIVLGIIALIYLVNPTGGFVEFIPDNIPILGNLDEATASVFVLNFLQRCGLKFFGRQNRRF